MTTPPSDASAPADDDTPSLTAARVAAAVGAFVAVALVVAAFKMSVWVGVVAAFFSPVVPMALVLTVEAMRR